MYLSKSTRVHDTSELVGMNIGLSSFLVVGACPQRRLCLVVFMVMIKLAHVR